MSGHLALVVTGGTIASTTEASGASAALAGIDLVERLPMSARTRPIEVEEVARVNGWNMTPVDMEAVVRAVRAEIERGAVGVVVTHGTDAMEETSLVVDMFCRHQTGTAPIVFTGAMRSADAPGFDGIGNLVDAIEVAGSTSSKGHGVLVVLHDEIHRARDIRKTRATGMRPFESLGGPVGHMLMGRSHPYCVETPTAALLPGEVRLAEGVHAVWTETGGDGTILDWLRSRGAVGLVLVGTGAGNVPAGYVEGVERAVEEGIPVIITSRCFGRTAPIYGGPGGHATLLAAGAIDGRGLSPAQARLALMAALGAGIDSQEVGQWLDML